MRTPNHPPAGIHDAYLVFLGRHCAWPWRKFNSILLTPERDTLNCSGPILPIPAYSFPSLTIPRTWNSLSFLCGNPVCPAELAPSTCANSMGWLAQIRPNSECRLYQTTRLRSCIPFSNASLSQPRNLVCLSKASSSLLQSMHTLFHFRIQPCTW